MNQGIPYIGQSIGERPPSSRIRRQVACNSGSYIGDVELDFQDVKQIDEICPMPKGFYIHPPNKAV